jgi:hypothetical protein
MDGRQRIDVTEEHRVEALAASSKRELRMTAADGPLRQHGKRVVEEGGGESLAPDLVAQRGRELDAELAGREHAVGIDRSREVRGRQLLARNRFEDCGERFESRLADRDARGKGMTAESGDDARRALRGEIERVAQVKARDRPPGALELAVRALREHDGGPVIAILEPPGDDPDDALMPIGVVQA